MDGFKVGDRVVYVHDESIYVITQISDTGTNIRLSKEGRKEWDRPTTVHNTDLITPYKQWYREGRLKQLLD